MSDLYTKLQRKAPKIARAYFKITHDDPKFFLSTSDPKTAAAVDQTGGEDLLEVALDGDAITADELDALIDIFQNVRFDDAAKEAIKADFNSVTLVEGLGRGVGKTLKSDSDLSDVYKALDLAGTIVNFTSPRTGLTYDVSQYQAMKRLVKTGDIPVVLLEDRGIVFAAGVVAMYDRHQQPPTLFMGRTSLDQTQLLSTFVHEMTHAIQDWNDSPGRRQDFETDAYITQGLVFTSLSLQAGRTMKKHVVSPVVDLLLDKKARSADPKAWKEALSKKYDTASDEVAKDPVNAAMIKLDPNPDNKKGDKIDEKKKLAEVLKALSKP